MIHLIQNCPRAHGYLKKILPKLQDLLFDSNESVKLSLIDLLISVKSIKTIQFWQICPLENILDRLMKDKKSVSAKITQLLFNSFFPLDQDDEAKLERCVFLIDHDLDAARYESYRAQCSKIGKKCNFKRAKTHYLHFQKWQKINFCTRKKFKIAFLVLLNFFLVQKLIFCHF